MQGAIAKAIAPMRLPRCRAQCAADVARWRGGRARCSHAPLRQTQPAGAAQQAL